MLDTLRADIKANAGNPKGILVVLMYRVARTVFVRGGGKWGWGIPYLLVYRFFVEWVLGIELPWKVCAGRGLSIHHGQGLVVNPKVKIGDYCTLRQGVTIGNKGAGDAEGVPVLGDNVDVGCGAIILGRIEIGDGSVLGAGSVVLRSVPKGATVAGNPARVLRFSEVRVFDE